MTTAINRSAADAHGNGISPSQTETAVRKVARPNGCRRSRAFLSGLLASRASQPAVEALDAIAADSDAGRAGVSGMAVRADLDADRVCG
jgi:hypothetical protein